VLCKSTKALDMSVDHKPDDPPEAQRIKNAGGYVEESRVNGMLALSRAIGDFEYKGNKVFRAQDQVVTAFPDVKIEPISPEAQYILLACDGIWDVMSSQEAITFCTDKIYRNKFGEIKRSIPDLTKGMESLLDHCCAVDLQQSQGLGCDNMTAIIVEIKNQN